MNLNNLTSKDDSNDYSSRQVICENFEITNNLGGTSFEHPFIKEATISNVIPQLPKYSSYQPSKILSFLSELTVDLQIHQETKFNLLLAGVFNVEYALFIHKQDQKNCYLLRAIGDMKLQNEIKFALPIEPEPGIDNNIDEDIIKNSAFKNCILDLIQRPIENIKVINGRPEENEIQYPFLLILLNRYLSLSKNDPKTIAVEESYQPKMIYTNISSEDNMFIRDLMRLLSPILNTLFHEDTSGLLRWLPETSKRMKIKFNELSAWVKYVTSLSKNLLNEDRVKINLTGIIEKFLKDHPNEIPTKKNKINNNSLNYDTIEQKEALPDKYPFHSETMKKCFSISSIKTIFCIPILAAGELLGIFKILRKKEIISFENIEKARIMAILFTFGIMHWQLQQQQTEKF